MDKVKFNDGREAPSIAFGTGTALYGHDAFDQVLNALENGVIHIDAAQSYANEESVGKAIAEYLNRHPEISRSDLYITTKISTLPASRSVVDAINTALKKLQLTYVDCYLIHSPIKIPGDDLKHAWKGMEEVQRLGLARTIGVSNFRVKDYELILPEATVIPAVNQIELHPYVWNAAKGILEFQKEHKIVTAVFGGLSPLFRIEGAPLESLLESIQKRLATMSVTATPAQILQKWLVQSGMVVVTTSSKASRIRESLAVPSLPELLPEEIAAIEKSADGEHRRFFQPHMDK
ncbi:Aldo/keto reductase [Clavulina sp. PMI_390]|nr:Aldo/keto reductase [Clavulina sp. PMI_390]